MTGSTAAHCADGLGVPVGDADRLVDAVRLRVPAREPVAVPDADAEEEAVSEGSTVKSTDAVGVGVSEAVPEGEAVGGGVAPEERVLCGVPDVVAVPEGVGVGSSYVTRTYMVPAAPAYADAITQKRRSPQAGMAIVDWYTPLEMSSLPMRHWNDAADVGQPAPRYSSVSSAVPPSAVVAVSAPPGTKSAPRST